MVRAKMICESNQPVGTSGADGATITLRPVIDGSEENKQFYKWTPGGDVSLSTINPEAAKQFVVGKQYYVDFTAAE